MSAFGSVTQWIVRLPEGDTEAVEQLFDRYYPLMLRLARKRMRGQPCRAADEEDVAICAFRSFLDSAGEGGFPNVRDRDSLWKLLVVITARKAQRQGESERRQKRGGGKVRGDSVCGGWHGNDEPAPGLEAFPGADLTPDLAVLVREQVDVMLEVLDDDSLVRVAKLRLEGYLVEEIAKELNCATRTVERKLALIREIWIREGLA